MLHGHRFLHGLAFAMLVGTGLLAPVTPALAQDGNVAALPPSVRAEGPTVVHDSAYDGVRTEVRSIDVPFSGLSVIVLNVRNMPQSARNRTFGAHAHNKACASDAAASNPNWPLKQSYVAQEGYPGYHAYRRRYLFGRDAPLPKDLRDLKDLG